MTQPLLWLEHSEKLIPVPDIRVQKLTKYWGPVEAINDISFEVQSGSLTVLLGPSGCGKSTILRLIAGLEDISSGNIIIGERDVTRLDPAQRGVSMVFQSYALFPHLTVRDNILFGLRVRNVPVPERNQRLQKAAAMVGLNNLLERKPAQLSGGQRQRVALARTIVSRRPVCLMDEPLSNLDARLRTEMRDEICSLQQKLGLTMIYVTHDQVEAMTMADQVVLLNEGHIIQKGLPETLYLKPETAFCARFMGSPPMNLLPLSQIKEDQIRQKLGLNVLFEPPADDWLIGIRPEDICLGSQGVPVTVKSMDYLGAETLLRLTFRNAPLFARLPGCATFEPETTCHMTWPANAVHLFDTAGDRWNG